MVMQAEKIKTYTPEEYLEQEVNSDERHEYIDGEIILMTGAMPNHNLIAGNLLATLNFCLKRQPYFVFSCDQRLWIPEKRIYTYPDVMVVRGELELQEGRKDTLTNPIFIAEVLSKSTQGYDRGQKFQAYRTIGSLQEYLLIDQYTMHVERYYRAEPNQWVLSEYNQPESMIQLNSIPCEISLADLYDKVDFQRESDGNLNN
ncbi:Uma2 family endonuclease [Roseofilum sp. BLCC_M154]|uniref:Uma2 family endonuclease n=1 Tax=Roseofilum acuticapitatum BLCC-M154 TaxID=3022444 RepID=A0ABT7AM57_9CYAN|nr:Uma2 family endonuclease [Roseofilum acuticapitatum]MDJ1167972.1 Uma2 family endonuclease [Roseofilum acuticapitatum BLCC-M154]